MSENLKEINAIENRGNATDPVLARLREIQIGEHERLVAEAHLARAEAIAELLARASARVRSAIRALFKRPRQRVAEALH